MYINDYDILIAQIIPPHWRSGWREWLIKSSLVPFRDILTSYSAYVSAVAGGLKAGGQVLVLENYLNTVHSTGIAIYIADDADNAVDFVVYVPNTVDVQAVRRVVEQHKLATKQYTIKQY